MTHVGQAIVIGMGHSGHRDLELLRTRTDADGVARWLIRHGYDVFSGGALTDLSDIELTKALADFVTLVKSRNTTVAALFFAGHGIENTISGDLLLLSNNSTLIQPIGISLRAIIRQLTEIDRKLKLIAVDSCRNLDQSSRNSSSTSPSVSEALKQQIFPSIDVALMLSASSGETVRDDDGTGRSPFLTKFEWALKQFEMKALGTLLQALETNSNGPSTPGQTPEIITSLQWSKHWTRSDVMSHPLNPLVIRGADEVGQLLTRFGSLQGGLRGVSAFFVLKDRQLYAADAAAYDDNKKLKVGYDFIMLSPLLDLYDSVSTFSDPVEVTGGLRAMLLSFEKAVIGTNPIRNSKAHLIEIAYPKSDYRYQDARTTRNDLEDAVQQKNWTSLTEAERERVKRVNYFSSVTDADKLDLLPLLNTAGTDADKKAALRRVFDLPAFNDNPDAGIGFYLLLKAAPRDRFEIVQGPSRIMREAAATDLNSEHAYLVSEALCRVYNVVSSSRSQIIKTGAGHGSHVYFGDLRSALLSFANVVIVAHPFENNFSNPPSRYCLLSVTPQSKYDYSKARVAIRNLLKSI
jgi:hypothetical protein